MFQTSFHFPETMYKASVAIFLNRLITQMIVRLTIPAGLQIPYAADRIFIYKLKAPVSSQHREIPPAPGYLFMNRIVIEFLVQEVYINLYCFFITCPFSLLPPVYGSGLASELTLNLKK